MSNVIVAVNKMDNYSVLHRESWFDVCICLHTHTLSLSSLCVYAIARIAPDDSAGSHRGGHCVVAGDQEKSVGIGQETRVW
jgi:hypothetical protein